MNRGDSALELLVDHGVWPRLTPEGVAIQAVYDARSGIALSADQSTGGLARIEHHGRAMDAKLGYDLEAELDPLEEELKRVDEEIKVQSKVVDARQQTTTETVKQQLQTQAEVAAIAAAKGQLCIWRRRLSKLPYLILLAVFGLGDVVLNGTALLVIGERDRIVWALAFALAVALLWVGHVAGTELREAEERPDPTQQRQRWWALGAMGIIFVFLIAIGYMRARYLDAVGVGGELLVVYALQLIVTAAAVAASYMHANPYADALEQAQSQVQRAQRDQEAEEELLGQLRSEREAIERQKVGLVARNRRVEEAAQSYIDDLKATYTITYQRVRQAAGRPAEFSVPLMQVPGVNGHGRTDQQAADQR